MVLVLEAGAEMGVNLQGIVVGGKLERQGRVTLLLKAPVGIQHLEKTKENLFTLWMKVQAKGN